MIGSGAPPTELWLEVDSETQAQSWEQSQEFSTSHSRWTVYLNRLCLDTFLPWLQTEYAPEAILCPQFQMLPESWGVVTGTAIQFGDKRIVLIPDKTLDTDELRVPQEWIDIPSWVGDYYLAVQVNPEGEWVRVWGYTTHADLKTLGHYDADDRTYSLDAMQLVQDLAVLWVVQQLYPDEPTQGAIVPLPALQEAQAANLLQRLAHPALPEPRLEVPFASWGALLDRADWRQSFYQARRGEVSPRSFQSALINLQQWLEGVFDDPWQSIDTLLGTNAAPAFNFRQVRTPTEPLVRRVRRLQLPGDERTLLLVLLLGMDETQRVSVQVQLYSADRESVLPRNLTLAMLSSTDDVIQSVQARDQDDCIQLKRFKCLPGRQFKIQVAIDDFNFIEAFTS